MSLWHILQREFHQLLVKDRKRFFALFGPCAVAALLFGSLFNAHVVKAVPTVVYDEDQSSLSRSLVEAFEDSESYKIVAHVTSKEEMDEYMHNKEALAAINIPNDFSKNVKTGHSPAVLVEINGTNMMTASPPLNAAKEIIQSFSNNASSSALQSLGLLPNAAMHKLTPITSSIRILHNSPLSNLDFLVLGLMMAALQSGIFLPVGTSIFYEYENKHKHNLHEASIFSVMFGKLLPYWFLGTLSFLMALTIATQVFHIPCHGNFTSLLALGMAFSFTITSFASLIAANCRSEVSFIQFSLAYSVLPFVLSGYSWPQSVMSPTTTVLSYFFPFTHFAPTVRTLMLVGHTPDLEKNILILLGIGTLLLTLSSLVYKSKLAKLALIRKNEINL